MENGASVSPSFNFGSCASSLLRGLTRKKPSNTKTRPLARNTVERFARSHEIWRVTTPVMDENKQAMIELRDTELDVNNGFAFVRLQITVGTAASLVNAMLIGFSPVYQTAVPYDQAGVVQIVG